MNSVARLRPAYDKTIFAPWGDERNCVLCGRRASDRHVCGHSGTRGRVDRGAEKRRTCILGEPEQIQIPQDILDGCPEEWQRWDWRDERNSTILPLRGAASSAPTTPDITSSEKRI